MRGIWFAFGRCGRLFVDPLRTYLLAATAAAAARCPTDRYNIVLPSLDPREREAGVQDPKTPPSLSPQKEKGGLFG